MASLAALSAWRLAPRRCADAVDASPRSPHLSTEPLSPRSTARLRAARRLSVEVARAQRLRRRRGVGCCAWGCAWRGPQEERVEGGVSGGSGAARRCARALARRLAGFAAHAAAFFDSTSVHGLKYLAEPRRPCHERFLWVLGISLSLGACAALVGQTWQRWRASPIIIAMDETMRPVWDFPFPAVTICPVNKINASKFNFSDVHARALLGTAKTDELNVFAELLTLCSIRNNLTSSTGNSTVEHIEKFAPDLSDTIRQVEFKRDSIPNAFQPILTEEGLCYSFNMLEGSQFFPSYTLHGSKPYLRYGRGGGGGGARKRAEWTVTQGYVEGAGRDAYPFRTVASGEDMGLTFTLEVSLCDMDAGCRDALEGHTVSLHSPMELPQPRQKGVRLPLAGGAKLSVNAALMHTDAALQTEYSAEQRQCFFPEERRLAFFAHYTKLKCELECLANFTLRRCGCVSFYMPRMENTSVCGSSDADVNCVTIAKDEFQEVNFSVPRRSGLGGGGGGGGGGGWWRVPWLGSGAGGGAGGAGAEAEPRGERERCRCLQTCVYVAYDASLSAFESQSTQWLNRIHKEKCNDMVYEDKTTLETSVSIYFENNYYIPLRRMERFGTIDFLANFGGLLGLCLGMSALSVLEFFYWLLVRPFCRKPTHKPVAESPR